MSVPFVVFDDHHHPRCYVCAGDDDFAARDPDETLRAILCARHAHLGEIAGLILRDRRPWKARTP